MANKVFKNLNTEKTHKMVENGVYAFLVPVSLRKDDIKKVVEKSFSVKVDKVRTSILPRKQKSFRGRIGFSNNYKKAYVKVASGMKIEFGEVAKA